MMPILYGIPNCGTVKTARAWLDARGIAYTFHDYRKAGVTADKLDVWCDAAGWEKILNRAGTTFKKLPDATKSDLDRKRAVALMVEGPSMIKRPIVEFADGLLVGFDAGAWDAAFGR
jgi:Spx/MgsR family transcriptional regulator